MNNKNLKIGAALFFIFFNGFVFADVAKEKEVLFFLKNKYSEGEYYLGKSAQLYIYSDLIRDSDNKYSAIIRMDDIDSSHPSIALVNAYLFEGVCEGTPHTYFHYSGKNVYEKVMPQVFSVSNNACIEIELYSLDESAVEKSNSKLKLVDRFKVKVATEVSGHPLINRE